MKFILLKTYVTKTFTFLRQESICLKKKKTLNQKFYFGHKVKIINKLKYRNGMR